MVSDPAAADREPETVNALRDAAESFNGRIRVDSNVPYAEVKAAYPTLSAVSPAVYGQSGVFVREGSDYLGFLMPVAPNAVQDTTRVAHLELAQGARPALAWDGC